MTTMRTRVNFRRTTVPLCAVLLHAACCAQTFCAGPTFSIAVCADGQLQGWGLNNGAPGVHHLGNAILGSDSSAGLPVWLNPIFSFNNIKAVAAGDHHVLALLNDGHVYGWGGNGSYQLGTGGTANSDHPVQVQGLADVLAISASATSSLALKSDGTVWQWGTLMITRELPEQVPGIDSVIKIASGNGMHMALRSDSTVWTWGTGPGVAHYDGLDTPIPGPVYHYWDDIIYYLGGIKDIATSNGCCFAMRWDGYVEAWGNNLNGNLGLDITWESVLSPITIPAGETQNTCGTYLCGVRAIASTNGSTLAVMEDGTLWKWAYDPVPFSFYPTATAMPVPWHAVAVAAGFDHFLVLDDTGELWSLGSNEFGQLGTAEGLSGVPPMPVASLCTMTGMNEEVSNQLNVYPNPTSEYITLTIPSYNLGQYEIHGPTGQLVRSGPMHSGSTTVDVRDLPYGLYSIHYQGQGQSALVARFIKE